MKKKKSIESLRSRYGLMFISPWLLGIALFFIYPILRTIWFSFADVSLSSSGIASIFLGFENYKQILSVDPDYTNNLASGITSVLTKLPLILVISLIIAIVLNQNFKGRVFFRGLYFLPVIIATGTVINLISASTGKNVMSAGMTSEISSSMIDFDLVLEKLNLPSVISDYLAMALSGIQDCIWNSGIQIVLFISGLQTIPDSLYEVAKVEGCTKWEEFWYITLPMLSRVILLVIIFTCVELFTMTQNPVMVQAYDCFSSAEYDTGAAMVLFYFAVIGVIMALVLWVLNKLCFRKWEA